MQTIEIWKFSVITVQYIKSIDFDSSIGQICQLFWFTDISSWFGKGFVTYSFYFQLVYEKWSFDMKTNLILIKCINTPYRVQCKWPYIPHLIFYIWKSNIIELIKFQLYNNYTLDYIICLISDESKYIRKTFHSMRSLDNLD